MKANDGWAARLSSSLAASLWRALLVGLTLILLIGTSLLALVQQPRAIRDSADNPRRPRFAELWSSVAEGSAVSSALSTMGPPDDQREQMELVRKCSDPCQPPCEGHYTCVVEYEWVSALEVKTAAFYSLCADAEGIVRRTSAGMRFNINSASPDDYGLAHLVAWGLLAFLCAMPLAVMIRVKRHLWPRRFTELTWWV